MAHEFHLPRPTELSEKIKKKNIMAPCRTTVPFSFQDNHNHGIELVAEIVNYARDNIAKVTIFLKDPYVERYIREEKITEITFVGTIGGLMGLFFGFSFISVVEIGFLIIVSIGNRLKNNVDSSGNSKNAPSEWKQH
jgi:hypothetical protein